MKRFLTMMVTACLLLTGCGGETTEKTPEYPAMALADISGMELAAGENDTVFYQFPADTWEAGTNAMGEPVVYWKEMITEAFCVNMTAKNAGYLGEPLNEAFCEEVKAGLENTPGFTINTAEMRACNGDPVYYLELEFAYTDAVIDAKISSGEWTEDALAAVGGREFFLNTPVTKIIHMYGVVDENCVTYAGAYYDDSQKQMLVDAMGVLYQTTEIK